jgi:hypothetical protein
MVQASIDVMLMILPPRPCSIIASAAHIVRVWESANDRENERGCC